MENNVCNYCATVNELKYKYCKNCGNGIIVEGEKNKRTQSEEFDNNSVDNINELDEDTILGVSTEELAAFVGKKANKILPRFKKMNMSNSEISWCLPPAVLGFLFGPLGAACWFLFRKMKKPAFVLVAIGLLLNGFFGFGIIVADIIILTERLLLEGMDSLAFVLKEWLVSQFFTAFNVSAFVSVLCAAVCGCFGFHYYKNHCVKRIIKYRNLQADLRYYKMGLASIGGVSGMNAVVGVVIMIVILSIPELISGLYF